ncbi:DegT/DnrJ/EryC1/StrS family aminotransferase [bacterium]|nr:DegT/DnrJ/EryC1/StrS family aminotransferase [bacterium]
MSALPPVATHAPLRAVLAPAFARARAVSDLEARIARELSGYRAIAASSGRAALTLILSALREKTGNDLVGVPAYTCYTVLSAIARAKMRAAPMDVSPETFDFAGSWNGASGDLAAIVSPGLFGIPANLPRLEQMAKDSGVLLIDDAAQTLGARVGGRLAGAFGGAAIVSFGRGKPLGALGGGALILRDPSITIPAMPAISARRMGVLARSIAGAFAVRPAAFDLARRLPGVRLGESRFDPDFAVEALDAARAELVAALWPELARLVERRRRIAGTLAERLRSIDGLALPRPPADAKSAWLRYPLVFVDPRDRDAALARLAAAGLGPSTMYPRAAHEIPEARVMVDGRFAPFPGAEAIARGILTLPTHEGVTARDTDRMAAIVRDVTGAGRE